MIKKIFKVNKMKKAVAIAIAAMLLVIAAPVGVMASSVAMSQIGPGSGLHYIFIIILGLIASAAFIIIKRERFS